MKIILASASPRRQELLKLITDDFSVIPASAEETVPPNIQFDFSPEYLAVKKAQEIAEKYNDCLVIGADTGVFLGNSVLGKPKNNRDAAEMLSSLSGKTHRVITGCALFYKGRHLSFSETTLVEFYALSKVEIENYISTGSPLDKAGSYGIQDKGSLFVKSINGDYFNVVGLPVSRLNKEIKNLLKICGE